ncbi:MAG TPA: hypothetical protein VFY65_11335 [Longimicrobium sp.]|nr:hypothetical protein [Longimicrobium sp.]
MHTQTLPDPRSAAAGRFGRRLLLALALCACGGEGGGAEKDVAADTPRAVALASQQAQDDTTCTTPAPVASAALLGGPWQVLADDMKRQGAQFPVNGKNADTFPVPLCKGCSPVRLVIEANVSTSTCVTPRVLADAAAKQSQVFLGAFVFAEAYPGDTAGWPAFKAGDTLALFANDTSSVATIVYRNASGAATRGPATWQFYYCQDNHPRTNARANWIARPRPNGHDDDDGGGTYGWMACASGCCQFYTPPPNFEGNLIDVPGKGNVPAPGAVGQGGNPGRGYGRPYWCTGTRPGRPVP